MRVEIHRRANVGMANQSLLYFNVNLQLTQVEHVWRKSFQPNPDPMPTSLSDWLDASTECVFVTRAS